MNKIHFYWHIAVWSHIYCTSWSLLEQFPITVCYAIDVWSILVWRWSYNAKNPQAPTSGVWDNSMLKKLRWLAFGPMFKILSNIQCISSEASISSIVVWMPRNSSLGWLRHKPAIIIRSWVASAGNIQEFPRIEEVDLNYYFWIPNGRRRAQNCCGCNISALNHQFWFFT